LKKREKKQRKGKAGCIKGVRERGKSILAKRVVVTSNVVRL